MNSKIFIELEIKFWFGDWKFQKFLTHDSKVMNHVLSLEHLKLANSLDIQNSVLTSTFIWIEWTIFQEIWTWPSIQVING